MTELSNLIIRLQKGLTINASYFKTIRHPKLLIKSLQELNDLIGNEKVKDSVATQVSHLIVMKKRALDNPNIKEDDVMMNTVLYGPPGVGKTVVGSRLAKIWYSLGYLQKSKNILNKEKKGEIGDMLKDLFKDNNSTSTTTSSGDDYVFLVYIMFIFIMIFITFLSMTWSFYSRFGGVWTIIVIVILLAIILMVGFYLSTIFNTNNVTQSTKNVKDSTTINSLNKNDKNNAVVDYISSADDYIPSDDEIITVVSRSDFVEKYVGWSDKKTIKLLEANLGKVVFVDEAYSLVTDAHDSFGIEVLTAINLFLSQHSKEIIVIFAGYKDLMETGLFSFQPGLRRRFMWQFDCNGYSIDQLFDIFKMQLNKKGWGLTDDVATKNIFRQSQHAFPAFGGDTERLTFLSELEHSRDFIRNEKNMSISDLTPDHVQRGIYKLLENNIQSDTNYDSTNPLANMMKMLRTTKSDPSNSDILQAMKNSAVNRTNH